MRHFNCGGQLKIHCITTKDQHSVVSYEDMLDADMFIVSVQFFLVRACVCVCVCVCVRVTSG